MVDNAKHEATKGTGLSLSCRDLL